MMTVRKPPSMPHWHPDHAIMDARWATYERDTRKWRAGLSFQCAAMCFAFAVMLAALAALAAVA